MKQRAVQNKHYYYGDFQPATTAPEVDTRVLNYELLSCIKSRAVQKRGRGSEGTWHKYINVPSGPQILARTLTGMTFLSALQLRSIK